MQQQSYSTQATQNFQQGQPIIQSADPQMQYQQQSIPQDPQKYQQQPTLIEQHPEQVLQNQFVQQPSQPQPDVIHQYSQQQSMIPQQQQADIHQYSQQQNLMQQQQKIDSNVLHQYSQQQSMVNQQQQVIYQSQDQHQAPPVLQRQTSIDPSQQQPIIHKQAAPTHFVQQNYIPEGHPQQAEYLQLQQSENQHKLSSVSQPEMLHAVSQHEHRLSVDSQLDVVQKSLGTET